MSSSSSSLPAPHTPCDLRAELKKVLEGAGLTDQPSEFDSSIHSWRCEYPDIYGRCSCLDELIAELVAVFDASAHSTTPLALNAPVPLEKEPEP